MMPELARVRCASTPKKLGSFSRRVQMICKRLNPDAQPVYLPYTDVGSGYAPAQCHINLSHRIREHGGERVNGWMIWELDGQFAEGEFHCVWQSPKEGALIDITPRRDGEQRILFLADPATCLQVGPHGGVLTPANRTTLPQMPFSAMGQPYSHPTGENMVDQSSRRYAARFGFDDPVAAVCGIEV